jgi:hypothetical protein
MTEPSAIQILSIPATAWARSRASFFFASGKASIDELSQQLLDGARLLAGPQVQSTRHGDWIVVASEVDWFACGRHRVEVPLLSERPQPFPELGQNCTRPEFVVAAFAAEVIVADADGACSLSELVTQEECARVLGAAMPGFKRAVAFRGLRTDG